MPDRRKLSRREPTDEASQIVAAQVHSLQIGQVLQSGWDFSAQLVVGKIQFSQPHELA